MSLTVTQAILTIADNNGSSEDFTDTTVIALDVVISNPCETTSIDSLPIDSTTLTVTDGDTT